MLNMLTNHPVLFRIMIYGMPILMFALGMFAMYVVRVRKPLNFKKMVDRYLGGRIGIESYENQFGISTCEIHKHIDRDFHNEPYHIYYIDNFGKSHEITHAQIELLGMHNNLALYSMKATDYDDKGRYRE